MLFSIKYTICDLLRVVLGQQDFRIWQRKSPSTRNVSFHCPTELLFYVLDETETNRILARCQNKAIKYRYSEQPNRSPARCSVLM